MRGEGEWTTSLSTGGSQVEGSTRYTAEEELEVLIMAVELWKRVYNDVTENPPVHDLIDNQLLPKLRVELEMAEERENDKIPDDIKAKIAETIRPKYPSLTPDQAQYLMDAFDEQQSTFVFYITHWDAEGWIFVENDDSVGQEGSGIWVDKAGQEHQGPHGPA
jgi:hypothetical protein